MLINAKQVIKRHIAGGDIWDREKGESFQNIALSNIRSAHEKVIPLASGDLHILQRLEILDAYILDKFHNKYD